MLGFILLVEMRGDTFGVVGKIAHLNPGTGLALIRLCKHAHFTITARGRAYNSRISTNDNHIRTLFETGCLFLYRTQCFMPRKALYMSRNVLGYFPRQNKSPFGVVVLASLPSYHVPKRLVSRAPWNKYCAIQLSFLHLCQIDMAPFCSQYRLALPVFLCKIKSPDSCQDLLLLGCLDISQFCR